MQLQLTAPMRRLLRLLPQGWAYSLIELALLAVLALQVARFIWILVTPVGPVGPWLPTRPAAVGAGALSGFDPFFRLAAPAATAEQPAAVTALQLTLFGTRIGGSAPAAAIIAGADGAQKSYSVGDEVMPGVTLKAVAFDHVTLSRSGGEEDLFLDQSKGAAGAPADAGNGGTGGGPSGTPSPAAAPVTLATLRSGIGFIPRIDGGKVTGLVVRPQGSGEIFRRVGLKEGDVVTQIGGRPVTGASDIEGLAAQYARGGNISLTVERGAELLPLVITVAPQ